MRLPGYLIRSQNYIKSLWTAPQIGDFFYLCKRRLVEQRMIGPLDFPANQLIEAGETSRMF